ncbi:uncharacterized protein LOC144167339 isoform X2 [Haemaphysalis longicornis]
MKSLVAAFLLGLSMFTWTPNTVWASSEPDQAVTNPFEILENMHHAYGMFDMDKDGDLDCSTANRTEINAEQQTATYIWELYGPDGEPITLHLNVKVVPGSDQITFTYGQGQGEEPASTATFLYADDTCVITALPLLGRPECVMGVPEEVKTRVSQSCISQFEENCHTTVLGFDKDTCSQWFIGEEIARSQSKI